MKTIIVNRFMMDRRGDACRIQFGEHMSGDINDDRNTDYHTAIGMTVTDALELADLINNILRPEAGFPKPVNLPGTELFPSSRRGVVRLSAQLLDDQPFMDLLRVFMHIKDARRVDNDRVEIYGYSQLFKEIPQGVINPVYLCEIDGMQLKMVQIETREPIAPAEYRCPRCADDGCTFCATGQDADPAAPKLEKTWTPPENEEDPLPWPPKSAE